jgi:hypothetical protein
MSRTVITSRRSSVRTKLDSYSDDYIVQIHPFRGQWIALIELLVQAGAVARAIGLF